MAHEIKIVAAVLALIRGEVTASCVAESFGVTELQVQGWKDVFQVAGVVALTNALKSGMACCEMLTEEADDGEPTTTPQHRARGKRRRFRDAEGSCEPTTRPPRR